MMPQPLCLFNLRRLPAAFALVLALIGGPSGIVGQPAPVAAPETPLRQGMLPNGLHYVVLPHPSPKGDLSLRLIVRAGSLDERDDERGFAHFVEHMAFKGTTHFPPGTIRAFFQRLGLTFGADLNANTSYTHTTYLLDLPDGHAGQLPEALIALRDYADGLLFPPEELAKESAVVISELHARDNVGRQTALQVSNALYAGTRLPDREVGGVTAQLEHATSDQLRAFYQRNYRPDRMTVLVVGPVDPAAVAEQIAAVFGSMAASSENVAPAPALTPAHFAGVKPAVIVLPTAKASSVELVSIGPRQPDTPEGRRQEFIQRIALAILDLRLRERREADLDKFGEARARLDAAPVGALVQPTIAVSTTAGDWADGVQLVETELRRAQSAGFTQAEVDEAVTGELTALRNRIASVASEPATRLAGDLVRLATIDRQWRPPEADLAEATQALQGLAATAATAAMPAIFPTDSLHLLLLVPPDNEPKPDRLLAAYTKSAGRALKTKSADAAALVFRYQDFGAPGPVAKRERVADLDLTLVSFANGVRLNVRPSDFEPGRFRLRVVFPLNLSYVPSDRGGIADLAGQLLLNSNLKRHTQTELARLIKLHGISSQFSVALGTPVLQISGPAAELPFGLRLLTALLSDLDLDLEHYRVALSHYSSEYQSTLVNAGPLALREVIRAYARSDDRVRLSNPRVFASQDAMDQVESWLVDHILNGPLEIGVVGDVTADDTVKEAAATVGTLRRRRAPPKPGEPLVAPKKASRQQTTVDLPASTSLSCVLWPVSSPDEPRQNAALTLATDALRDHLLAALRDFLGATYSPEVTVHRDTIQRDFAFAVAIITLDPARAQQYTEGNIRLAAHLAERGVTPDQFARLREPARAKCAEDMHSNAWWLDAVVAIAQSRPEVLDLARRHAKIFDEVTLDDVNRAVNVFQPDHVTALILRPASADRPAGEGAAKNK
jgi:zinc protease